MRANRVAHLTFQRLYWASRGVGRTILSAAVIIGPGYNCSLMFHFFSGRYMHMGVWIPRFIGLLIPCLYEVVDLVS